MSIQRLRYEYFSSPGKEHAPDKLVVTITREEGYLHFNAETYHGALGMQKCPPEQADPELLAVLDTLHRGWQEAGCAFTGRPNITVTGADGIERCVMGVLTTARAQNLTGDAASYQHAMIGKVHDVITAAGMRHISEPGLLRDSMVRRDMQRLRSSEQNPENIRPIGR